MWKFAYLGGITLHKIVSYPKRYLTRISSLRYAQGFVVCTIVVQCAILGFNRINDQSPILGVQFEGQIVSLLSQRELDQKIDMIASASSNKPITVRMATYSGTITLRQLGQHANIRQIATTVLQTGRTGNVLQQIIAQDGALLGRSNVSTSSTPIDQGITNKYLETLNNKIATSPTNAYFEFRDSLVVVHPDSSGTAIDTKKALGIFQRLDMKKKSDPLVLPTLTRPAIVTAEMLKPLVGQVQNIAEKPLKITAGSGQIILSKDQLISLVEPKIIPDVNNPSTLRAQISFNELKLNAAIDAAVQAGAVAPTPTTVSNGRVVTMGTIGLQSEDDHPSVHVLAALLQRKSGGVSPENVQIPLVKIDPPVIPVVSAPGNSDRNTKNTKEVYITIDDGPGQFTDKILDILKQNNAHATFYVVGRNAQRYSPSMQRMRNEGHTIGNHSYSHRDLSHMTKDTVLKELTDAQAAIQKASGIVPTEFRPPYGAQNQTVRDVAAGLGLADNLWTVDPRDWAQPGSTVITQRVLNVVRPGSVVLLHVLHQQTVDALPAIITGIRAKGLTIH